MNVLYIKHGLLLQICRVYPSNPQGQQFCIFYCILYLNTDRICIFVDIEGGHVEGWRFVLIWRSVCTFSIALDVFAHIYNLVIILKYKHIWDTSMSGWIVLVVSSMCYGILSLTLQTQHYLCFGQSWVSITNNLSTKRNNCSFSE